MPALHVGLCPAGFERVFGPKDEPLCLAVSTCEETTLMGMVANCRPADPTRNRPAGELDCRSYPRVAEINFVQYQRNPAEDGSFVFRGMVCPRGYPDRSDSAGWGCSDAYGQRVKWSGSTWTVIGPNSWFWHGWCPPKLVQPCPTPPGPSGCQPDPDKECAKPAAPGQDHTGPWGCCHLPDPTRFKPTVEAAVAAAMSTHPEWRGFVLNRELFKAEVIVEVNRRGLCAAFVGNVEDEIAVKQDGSYSEQYDIICDSCSRGGPTPMANHAASCTPARF